MYRINLENARDRWQWACPHGHRTWEPTNHHWWCATCAEYWDVDPEFDELKNLKTGEMVRRDDVQLEDALGPFETAPRAGAR